MPSVPLCNKNAKQTENVLYTAMEIGSYINIALSSITGGKQHFMANAKAHTNMIRRIGTGTSSGGLGGWWCGRGMCARE